MRKPAGFKSTAHSRTTKNLLEMMRDQGHTLEYCASPKVMNRSIATLRRWCRRFDISFPDYTPPSQKNA